MLLHFLSPVLYETWPKHYFSEPDTNRKLSDIRIKSYEAFLYEQVMTGVVQRSTGKSPCLRLYTMSFSCWLSLN